MIQDKNRIFDGFTSLEGGVDAGRVPSLIDPNQCATAENMTFRGGHVTTRPGIRKLAETFVNPDHSYYENGTDASIQVAGPEQVVPGQEADTNYRTGILQCVIGYKPHHGEDSLMVMIGGRLYKIIPRVTSAVVTEIHPITDGTSPYSLVRAGTGQGSSSESADESISLESPTPPAQNPLIFNVPYRNRSDIPIAYMVQADKWLFVQDGNAKPIIYDGEMARRSNLDINDQAQSPIPVGTILSYGMGRVCVVVNDRDVAFGDLYGSHDLPDPADSLPLFTERNFLAGGFDAAIPFQQGVATGMAFFPQLDTSTGNGQLLVFAERGAAAFFLSLDRLLWQTSQFQILALLTTGLRGSRSISVVNEDLWFRSDDGYRSFRQARSEPSGWAHIPLSTNVGQFLDVDTNWLLKFASSIYFDNRIIATCTPYWNNGRPYHTGLVAVDFDVLSSFGTKFRPTWDGHWQKQMPLGNPTMKVTQLFTGTFNGETRAFIFGLEQQPHPRHPEQMIEANQLYEISLDDKDDFDGPINWELESKAFDFKGQSNPFEENELYDGDIWLRDIIQ